MKDAVYILTHKNGEREAYVGIWSMFDMRMMLRDLFDGPVVRHATSMNTGYFTVGKVQVASYEKLVAMNISAD